MDGHNKPVVTLATTPLDYPCGAGSACCGSIGQTEGEVAALKQALEETFNVLVEVVNVRDGKQMRTRRHISAIVRAFGFSCLPILAVGEKVVAMGGTDPAAAIDALHGALAEDPQ